MKLIKKMLAVFVAVLMTLAMSVTAFAATDGSITITNENDAVSMKGHTYTAYKIFDVTYDSDKKNYDYKVSQEFKAYFDSLGIDNDADAYTYVTQLKNDSELQSFAKDAYTNKGVATGVSKTATEDNRVVIDGLDHGYYLVYDEGNPNASTNAERVVAAIALTTTDPDAEVELKADATKLDKTITGVSDEKSNTPGSMDVDAVDAQIGKHIQFRLDSNVPDLTGYTDYTYVVTDTMSEGLTNDVNVKVTINGSDLTSSCEVVYNGQKFTVKVPYSVLSQFAKDVPIVITYSATLNENAIIYPNGANINTANLEYSNNPNEDTTDKTPDVEVKVYTFTLDITKVNGKGTPLAGAQFVLKDANGNFVPVSLKDGRYIVSETLEATEANATVISDENGKIYIDGVQAAQYTLTETVAPDGYNLLKSPIKVNIEATYDDEVTEVTEITGNEKTIINRTGSILPSTGGIGTTVFTVGGLAIILVSAALLVIKRRKNVTE